MDEFKSLEDENKATISDPQFWATYAHELEAYFAPDALGKGISTPKPKTYAMEACKNYVYTLVFHPEDCTADMLLHLHPYLNENFLQYVNEKCEKTPGPHALHDFLESAFALYKLLLNVSMKVNLANILQETPNSFIQTITANNVRKVLMQPKQTNNGTIAIVENQKGKASYAVNISKKKIIETSFSSLEKRSTFNHQDLYCIGQTCYVGDLEIQQTLKQLQSIHGAPSMHDIFVYVLDNFAFDRQQTLFANPEEYFFSLTKEHFPEEYKEKITSTKDFGIDLTEPRNIHSISKLLTQLFQQTHLYQKKIARTHIQNNQLIPLGGRFIDIPTQLQSTTYQELPCIKFIGKAPDGMYHIVITNAQDLTTTFPLEGITDEEQLQREYPDFIYHTPLHEKK